MTKESMMRTEASGGFLLVEVLVALALFALCATYVVNAAFTATRFQSQIRDERALEADLKFALASIARKSEQVKEFEEGGEIECLSIGEVEWSVEIEGGGLPHLYMVTIDLSWDGNSELGIEKGEKSFKQYYFRTKWYEQDGERARETDLAGEEMNAWMEELAESREPTWSWSQWKPK